MPVFVDVECSKILSFFVHKGFFTFGKHQVTKSFETSIFVFRLRSGCVEYLNPFSFEKFNKRQEKDFNKRFFCSRSSTFQKLFLLNLPFLLLFWTHTELWYEQKFCRCWKKQNVGYSKCLFKSQQCFHSFARARNKYICSQAVASRQRRNSDHLARADTNRFLTDHEIFESPE